MALIRTDAFRDIDRFLEQFWASPDTTRTHAVPMDAYRKEDSYLIFVDLPGIDPKNISVTVENNVLTVHAERVFPDSAEGVERLISERPYGTFNRQVFLGTSLDSGRIQADYEAGVLTIAIPIAEHAKARRIDVASREDRNVITA